MRLRLLAFGRAGTLMPSARRGLAAGVAAVLLTSACSASWPTAGDPGSASRAGATCPAQPVDMSYDMRVLDVLRIYTGTDGVSHAEQQVTPAKETVYLGALLREYAFGAPSNVVIVSGPPGFRIAQHPAPYREFFVILAGSSIMQLSDGTERPLKPGSVMLVEDVTGPGHGGVFGPCGYVALDMQFKAPGAAHL